jgi:hypothetical protein
VQLPQTIKPLDLDDTRIEMETTGAVNQTICFTKSPQFVILSVAKDIPMADSRPNARVLCMALFLSIPTRQNRIDIWRSLEECRPNRTSRLQGQRGIVPA